MDAAMVAEDLSEVLLTRTQISDRLAVIARQVERDYEGRDLLLVGVLKGAVMVMADFSRELRRPVEMDWMAVSSYGRAVTSSGSLRILMDLEIDLTGRHVLLVEDIIDSGLTLSWLQANLRSRGAASVEILALLRKPEAVRVPVDIAYLGFDIPNAFVVGYGLDYDERYRSIDAIAVLRPEVYGVTSG